MTTQTLAADVLDALLTVWRADATLTAYGTDQLRIYDGAPLLDRAAPIELWVGSTGIADEETVITGTQEWVTVMTVSSSAIPVLPTHSSIGAARSSNGAPS